MQLSVDSGILERLVVAARHRLANSDPGLDEVQLLRLAWVDLGWPGRITREASGNVLISDLDWDTYMSVERAVRAARFPRSA